MSRTHIDYDVVVEELSKGLAALDSEEVLRCCMLPHLALAEFRTIRFGAGRQRGATGHILKMVNAKAGKSLILTPSLGMLYSIQYRISEEYPDMHPVPVICAEYPVRIKNQEFTQVFIEDAGIYFKKFSYDRVFKYLTECTTDDVVIHLIN